MIHNTILLEARAPERNIWRSYHIAMGQDLFGNWIVELTYGRIGAKGRKQTILAGNEEEARRYMQQCLNRRKSARKRIGINYEVIGTSGVGV
jgi:WGR domain